MEIEQLAENRRGPDIDDDRIIFFRGVSRLQVDELVSLACQYHGHRNLPVRVPQELAHLFNHTEIRRNPLKAILLLQVPVDPRQVAHIVLLCRRRQLKIPLEDRRIDGPSLHQLVDILRGQYPRKSRAFPSQYRTIDLRLDGYLHNDIRGRFRHTRQAITLFYLPLLKLWHGRKGRLSLDNFNLALPASSTSTTRGIDMDTRRHGSL